jgi:hypothetical protein
MSFPTGKSIYLSAMAVAMTAAFFTGCNESPNSPAPVTSAEARADLVSLASKVKYFVPQDGGGGMETGGFEKRAAAKPSVAPVAPRAGADCDQESIAYMEYEESELGIGMTAQFDTTVYYTAANQPICAEDDVVAYEITAGRSVSDMLETRIKSRLDYPADFFTGDIKITGSGTVQYKDGYLITISSMVIVINFMQEEPKTYYMDLALEKGYTVRLKAAPGANPMSEEPPAADEVCVTGPIIKDGTVVGYFEVKGDNSVIIRDANKAIIESHG